MKSSLLIVRRMLCAFAVLCAFHGQAAAIDIGDLTNASYVKAYSYAPGTAINDVFHFNLSEASSFNAIASEIYLPTFFNISNFSLTLTIPSVTTLTFGPTATSIWTGELLLPQANDYTLTVSGLVDGTLGGGYSVLMAAAAMPTIPVPEPAEWLLLLAGLLLIAVFRSSRPRFTAGI
jgi:hypothetical protein